jgi:septum formation protein
MHRRVVLASSSRFRASMLAAAGIEAFVDPPEVDERAWDDQLGVLGPDGLALELADRKAAAVAPRHADALVVAGDQVGVVRAGGAERLLTKQPLADGAVEQLMTMSGTTHELVNGLVVLDTATGRRASGVDRQLVTMRRFTRGEASAYVERFTPYDSSGSYRLEDQEQMAPLEPFVTEVRGEHDSGVLGLPLPLLGRLLSELGEPAALDVPPVRRGA